MNAREPLIPVDPEQQNAEASLFNRKLSLALGAADSADITIIFFMFLTAGMREVLETTARFALFPFAAAAALGQAGLAWRQARLDKGKNGTVTRAFVETGAALAISVAVAGGLSGAAIFAALSPIIFVGTMMAKTLYHFGSATYYWGKSIATQDETKKAQYRSATLGHTVGMVGGALSTIAVGFVMIAAQPLVAVVGIAAGLLGLAFSIYKFYQLVTSATAAKKAQQGLTAEEAISIKSEDGLTNSAKLQQTFNPDYRASAVTQQISPTSRAGNSNTRAYWEKPVTTPTVTHTASATRTFTLGQA